MSELSARFPTDAGTLVLVEPEHALPIVHVGISLRTGSVHDPARKEGLARLTARMVRMGTRKLSASAVEERIDALGAQLGVGCAPSYMHFGGAVVAHNLEPFFQLLCELLCEPAFRAADVARVKRESLAELVGLGDDDRALAARHFRRFALRGHPYGRPVNGTTESIRGLTRADVMRSYEAHFVSENAVVGMAGAVDPAQASELVTRYLRLRRGHPPRERVPEPRFPKGRRVLVVDKPERTQAQVLIGTLGTKIDDPDHTALLVANTVFGGLFTARLTKEVRSVRGLSYGASSSLGQDRKRELWSMWTFPAAKDARECIELQLGLYDRWVKEGVRESELRLAKSYLVKSHAFEVDTAAKRLDQRIEEAVFGLPADYHSGFTERVSAVTVGAVKRALGRRLSRKDLAIVVVATAKELRAELARLPGVRRVEVVPFDRA